MPHIYPSLLACAMRLKARILVRGACDKRWDHRRVVPPCTALLRLRSGAVLSWGASVTDEPVVGRHGNDG
jgi:hypothetical protein